MSTNEDFVAEVTGGYLVVAIKIPTTTCAGCGVVYTPTVSIEHVRQLHRSHHDLQSAFGSPWCQGDDTKNWVFITKPDVPYPEPSRALVCASCGKSVVEARRAGALAEKDALATVASRITRWFQ